MKVNFILKFANDKKDNPINTLEFDNGQCMVRYFAECLNSFPNLAEVQWNYVGLYPRYEINRSNMYHYPFLPLQSVHSTCKMGVNYIKVDHAGTIEKLLPNNKYVVHFVGIGNVEVKESDIRACNGACMQNYNCL